MTHYLFNYSYADLERLTGMTKSGISQNVTRGKLVPDDLVSVAAFLGRHGTPEVRLAIMSDMLGIDRMDSERARPQSTRNVGRTSTGKVRPVSQAKLRLEASRQRKDKST